MAHSQSSPLPAFNRSPLVQLLAGLQISSSDDSAQTFAEKLSHWVAWKDAIGLSSALDARAPERPSVEPLTSTAIAQVVDLVRGVHEDLASAISLDGLLAHDVPVAARQAVAAITINDESHMMDFASYRRCYMTHQRAMDERIGRVRADVRATIAGVSGTLARLAALDAAMEQALAVHQRRAVGRLPALLEKHFKKQHASRPQPAAPIPGDIAPAVHEPRAPAVGLLVQQALLAELALRLQPVTGMVDALCANAGAHP